MNHLRRSFWSLSVALAFSATALLLSACGSAPKVPEIKAGPPVPGLNMNGLWYSQQFGDMTLVQNGNLVTGKYENPRGPEHDGRIKGQIEGDLLRVEWIEPGDSARAVFPQRGKAWFRIKRGGTMIEGRWGYKDSNTNGGHWRAEKSKFQ